MRTRAPLWIVASLTVAACRSPGARSGGTDASPDLYVSVDRFSDALEETVTFERNTKFTRVRFADGRRIGISEFRRAEAAAHRSRFGALRAALAMELQNTPRDIEVEIAVYFDVRGLRADTSTLVRSANPARRVVGRQEVLSSVKTASARMRGELARLGMRDLRAATHIPVIAGRASVATALAVARLDDVALVTRASAGAAIETATMTDPVPFASIDSTFNASGVYATGQRYGILEAGQHEGFECGLYDGHESLEFSPVTYQASPAVACSSDSDCAPSFCDRCSADGICVTDHGSEVASVTIASDDGTPRSAAYAEVFFPNAQPVCDAVGIADSYAWLISNDVFTTNESFGCGDPDAEGFTQDFAARVYGVTVVRAAGNSGVEGRACEFLANALCVGGVNESLGMSCFSSTSNPFGSDREEPDVTALAGDSEFCALDDNLVRVMDVTDHDTWSGNAGTSFAAPAISALVLLLREQCEGRFGFIDEKLVRAIFRTSAWPANPDGAEPYSTPASGFDYADGGGWLPAGAAAWCDPTTGPENEGGTGTIDLDAGDPLPDGDVTYEPGTPRAQEPATAPTDGTQRAIELFAYTPPTDGTRRAVELFAYDLAVGDRVRFTFSWDACVTSDMGTAPAATAVDFDLFLYRDDGGGSGAYIYGSQSIDDVNEGFDVTIGEPEGAGTYRVFAAWPEGAVGCDGSHLESFGWATVWWR